MQNKGTVVLWVLMALLMLYSPLFAQIKPADRKMLIKQPPEEKPKYTEEEVIEWIDREISDCENPDKGCFEAGLNHYAEIAVLLKSDKIVQKILDVPESESFNEKYPEYAFDVTEAKIRALSGFENYPGVREFVMQSLDHKSSGVQLAAASCVIGWGEWELGAPIICKQEAYIVFQSRKDERAIPLLEDAVINGSWHGRIKAADALFYIFGDSTKLPEVALDIILNTPINTDDEDINRAKYQALWQVPRFNLTAALPGLCRLAYDDVPGISSIAVKHLVHFRKQGYKEASQALIDIRDKHPNASTREQAKKGLPEQEQE